MKRILLDTNIYGLIAVDNERGKIILDIIKCGDVFYATRLIRQELRAVPEYLKFNGRNMRVDLLSLFDELIKSHICEITAEMKDAANNYNKAYKEFGGLKTKEEIINDFLIVACASFHNMDILVSSDEKTMSSENAQKAYSLVNNILKKRTPRFINYETFKKSLKKRSF